MSQSQSTAAGAPTAGDTPARGTPSSEAGSGSGAAPAPERTMSTDPQELTAEIEATREHLVATVDELTQRLQPKVLARGALADARGAVQAAVRTPEGSLRVERLAAVGAAVAVLVSFAVWSRRRRRR